MKNIIHLLVLLCVLSLPVMAGEYISSYDFAVVGNKAYLIESQDGQSVLIQYSFPELVAAHQVTLSSDFSYAIASTDGVIVTNYTYDIPTATLVAEGDGSSTKGYKDVRTIQTYDLALQPVATKTIENQYYYTFDDTSSLSADGTKAASGKATAVDKNKCGDKKHKGKNKACNKVLL